MFEGWDASLGVARLSRRFTMPLAIALALFTAGCGSVAVTVEQPVGARVELYRKAKWFGACGPDWGTAWSKVSVGAVQPGRACDLEMEARNGCLDSLFTCFPRQYRAFFDLTGIQSYPKTPSSVFEIRYEKEVIPTKYQDIIRLWNQRETLEVLTRLPVDVLADVLYSLGDLFKERILADIDADVLKQARERFDAMLKTQASGGEVSPKEVESWLKSFLKAEHLLELCKWVEADSVPVFERRYVQRGGRPTVKGRAPAFPTVVDSVVEALFSKGMEVKGRNVNIFREVILRDLRVNTVETKLVAKSQLRFFAEIYTYRTSYYSDRTAPLLDLVQDIGLADVVSPTPAQQAELNRVGMTRSESLDAKAREDAIRSGLPPVGLKSTKITSLRSQVLGTLLEGEMVYVVVWNNPVEQDTARFLTTFVTAAPYGMARVWTVREGKVLWEGHTALRMTDAPLRRVVSWVTDLMDRCSGGMRLKPVTVIVFGNRAIAPWRGMPEPDVSLDLPAKELEPAGGGEQTSPAAK